MIASLGRPLQATVVKATQVCNVTTLRSRSFWKLRVSFLLHGRSALCTCRTWPASRDFALSPSIGTLAILFTGASCVMRLIRTAEYLFSHHLTSLVKSVKPAPALRFGIGKRRACGQPRLRQREIGKLSPRECELAGENAQQP